MHADCIEKVIAAANGRRISESKLKAIENAIGAKMRDIARRDPEAWSGLSREQRVSEAAREAMAEIEGEAGRKEYLGTLQILKTEETNRRIADMKTVGGKSVAQSEALIRDIENSHHYVQSVHDEAVGGLKDMLDAAESKDGTGILRNLAMRIWDMDNPKMTGDVIREIFRNADGHTGNKIAKAGAESWLKTIESLRVRFNASGGDVGKLAYGYLAQNHDPAKIVAVDGKTWAEKVIPLLDRRQYLNEDGTVMTDAQLLPVLQSVHETLASNGLNKIEPGQYKGMGKRANAGSDRRVLHFKDGDAWMQYMGDFGEGSLYDSMLGHIGHMARNIGLVERYGPNPEMNFKLQADMAQRADGVGTMDNRGKGNTPDAYWSILSGKTSSPENATIAKWAQDLRNVQTAAKLGGAVITSFTDVATIAHTLHYDRLPYFDMIKNVGRQFSKDQREFLQAHGVIAESLTSTLNRWTGDNMTHSLTGRVANSVMKLSFMNAWADGLRGAFSATMMQGFAKKLGKEWNSLDDWDRWLMSRKGITEQDWNIITQAQATERGGVKYLTRDGITATGANGAQSAATKWMAFVSDESQFAVINPDMATRAIVTGGGMPSGTVRGEAMRTFMQFKSFPLAMMTRHWSRIFETPQGLEGAPTGFGATTSAGGTVNKIAVLAGLNVSLMMLGAVVMQAKAIVSGKDPYEMDQPKFWMRAMTQGGGMGYLGDLIFKDPTEQHGTNTEQTIGSILGPSAGAVAGLVGDIGLTNVWEAAKGKDTHFAAESLRWANSQIPYVGLWQVRSAWDHWVIHHAQEAANPGYLSRMRSRAMRDWNQDYWWTPGEIAPHRAPDLSAAGGK